MKFFLLHVCTLLSVAFAGSHAVTPEVYWKSVLPNSPMPKSIKDLLYKEWNDEKSTTAGVGKGGVSVHSGKPGKTTNVGVGKGGVEVHTGHKGKSVYVGVLSPFIYYDALSMDQLKDNPNVAMFFSENNLHQGIEFNLHFTKTGQKSTFLPRKIADLIPFSSNKLPQIYNKLSVKPDSIEAKIMKQTLNECENKGIEGEEKCCATSLESMVDFSTTKLGTNVKAISTEVNTKESTPLQKYKMEVAKRLAANKAVVCHKQSYPYAVFYCHKTVSTETYAVSMVGVYGTKVKAVAVCHTDTAKWSPKHWAFQVLKVKPGTVPICHILPEDHVVWVPY